VYHGGVGVYHNGVGVYPDDAGVYHDGVGVYHNGVGVYPDGVGVYHAGVGVYHTGAGVYHNGAGVYHNGAPWPWPKADLGPRRALDPRCSMVFVIRKRGSHAPRRNLSRAVNPPRLIYKPLEKIWNI
jgi:hypothetical protein